MSQPWIQNCQKTNWMKTTQAIKSQNRKKKTLEDTIGTKRERIEVLKTRRKMKNEKTASTPQGTEMTSQSTTKIIIRSTKNTSEKERKKIHGLAKITSETSLTTMSMTQEAGGEDNGDAEEEGEAKIDSEARTSTETSTLMTDEREEATNEIIILVIEKREEGTKVLHQDIQMTLMSNHPEAMEEIDTKEEVIDTTMKTTGDLFEGDIENHIMRDLLTMMNVHVTKKSSCTEADRSSQSMNLEEDTEQEVLLGETSEVEKEEVVQNSFQEEGVKSGEEAEGK